jgi:hypothetical protein
MTQEVDTAYANSPCRRDGDYIGRLKVWRIARLEELED